MQIIAIILLPLVVLFLILFIGYGLYSGTLKGNHAAGAIGMLVFIILGSYFALQYVIEKSDENNVDIGVPGGNVEDFSFTPTS